MLQNLNAFVAYSALAELVITEGTVFRRPFNSISSITMEAHV